MPAPILHIIAGPNGAGKSTYYEQILGLETGLPFINADVIAREYWPEDPESNAYEAAAMAAAARRAAFEAGLSFATETVFSHPSKVELLHEAQSAGYLVSLHVIAIPENLAVARVTLRVQQGGHSVPEEKIRQRFRRLWPLLRQACFLADEALIFENVRAEHAFRRLMTLRQGRRISVTDLPGWLPADLKAIAEN